MLKKTAIFLVVLVLLVVVVGFFLPAQVHIERALQVQAASTAIYPHVASFKNGWSHWSPWNVKKDPTLEYTYEGAESGVGAIEKWTSDKEGPGTMEITASDPAAGIEYKISFDEGTTWQTGAIKFAAAGDATDVSWTFDMDCGMNLLFRYMMVLYRSHMDSTFDEGLANLKKHVETAAGKGTNG